MKMYKLKIIPIQYKKTTFMKCFPFYKNGKDFEIEY